MTLSSTLKSIVTTAAVVSTSLLLAPSVASAQTAAIEPATLCAPAGDGVAISVQACAEQIATSARGSSIDRASLGSQSPVGQSPGDVADPADSCRSTAQQLGAAAAGRVNFVCVGDAGTLTLPATSDEQPAIISFDATSGVASSSAEAVRSRPQAPSTTTAAAVAPNDFPENGNAGCCDETTHYVRSDFRGDSLTDVAYGTSENNVVIFSSYVTVKTITSLQARSHFNQVSWSEQNNRAIGLTIPARIQRNVGFATDPTVDSTTFNNDVYATSYSSDAYLYTAQAGEHYLDLYNLVINDREYGSFPIGGEIEGPRFNCTADTGENCTMIR